jgi:hypothetical protein
MGLLPHQKSILSDKPLGTQKLQKHYVIIIKIGIHELLPCTFSN